MAQNYTVTLTNKQDAALTDVVAAYNAPLLLQTPPGTTLTNAQYVQQVFVLPAIEQLMQQAVSANADALIAATKQAADANDKQTLNKIRTDLVNGGYISP